MPQLSGRSQNQWRYRWDIVVPILWISGTIVGLVLTLNALENSDFDGLNNIYQIPFALPWFILPTANLFTHEQDAWIVAAEGLLNAVIISIWLRARRPT